MTVPKMYKDFYEQKVFTFEDLLKRYKKENAVGSLRVMLYKGKTNGYIGTIKSGLYYIVPQEFSGEEYIVDKYLAASKLSPTVVLAYHSALELHGVAQSTFNSVFMLSKQKITNFNFQDTKFIAVRGNLSFGQTTIMREGIPIPVTDRERTLIDGVDRLKYMGGPEEYLKSIETFPSVNFQRIIEYLKRYNKQSLYSKVGFILSMFAKKWSFPEDVRKKLKLKIKNKVYYLADSKSGGRFIKEWNLMVPRKLKDMLIAS